MAAFAAFPKAEFRERVAAFSDSALAEFVAASREMVSTSTAIGCGDMALSFVSVVAIGLAEQRIRAEAASFVAAEARAERCLQPGYGN